MTNDRLLMTLILASLLTACNASTRLDGEKIVGETSQLDKRLLEEKAPGELRRGCDDPVIIPPSVLKNGRLNSGPAERLWRRDRIALVKCGEKQEKIIEFYDDRDARIAATAKP